MVRLGVIGAGFMGGTHARALARLPGAEVAWVVSRSEPKAEALAREVGARWTTDWRQVLDDPEVDAVSVTYPTELHASVSIEALRAGKRVICEKPIASSLAEADAMIEAARAAERGLPGSTGQPGRVLMVAHVLRFWPEYREIARRVREGELGRVLAVDLARLSSRPDWSAWIQDAAQTGGTVVDLMVHDFDFAAALLGRPREVFARGVPGPSGGMEHVHAILSYESTTIAEITGSQYLPETYPFSSAARVVGERQAVEYQFQAGGPGVEAGKQRSQLVVYPRRGHGAGEARTVPLPPEDPFEAELAYFLACINEDRPAEEGTPEQAREALELALAARTSMELREPVRLDG